MIDSYYTDTHDQTINTIDKIVSTSEIMLLALISFCFVASITPGPNNMLLLSSGATFGFRRTLPHILGISAGCVAMLFVLGWGVGCLTDRLPEFYFALHVAATVYLLWLAFRIAAAGSPGKLSAGSKPLGIWGAAAFQWVNPKAWAMVVGAIATFARPERMIADVALIAGVLILVGLPSITLWAVSGALLQSVLQRPLLLRLFNWSMASLLVISLLPGWWEELAGLRRAAGIQQ